MKKKYVVIIILGFISKCLYGQRSNYAPEYFEVNMPSPNYTINNVNYYSTQRITGKDFMGKWVFLDLWDKDCGACMAVLPQYDSFQQKYSDKIRFVSVGKTDIDGQAKMLYEKYKAKYHLSLPCAFDSAFFHQFDINSSPYLIVIDPSGTVKAITAFLNESELKDLLAGKYPELQKVYREHEPKLQVTYTPNNPFLTYNNGGEDSAFLTRSILSRYDPQLEARWPLTIKDSAISDVPGGTSTQQMADEFNATQGARFEVFGAPVIALYEYPFWGETYIAAQGDTLYGKVWPEPTLEVKDSSIFEVDNFYSAKNRYSYSLTLPEKIDSRMKRMKVMQHNLEDYFGFKASLQLRRMPYWSLEAAETAKIKLRTKGAPPSPPPGKTHSGVYTIVNHPVWYLLWSVFPMHMASGPVIDETGIDGNIDIKLNSGFPATFDSFIKALSENGLMLIKKEKVMQVLVLSDQ